MADGPIMPGLQGSSYHHPELTELLSFSSHDPFTMSNPDGWVEITEQADDCPCEVLCKWLDGNYTDFECICEDGSLLEKGQIGRASCRERV